MRRTRQLAIMVGLTLGACESVPQPAATHRRAAHFAATADLPLAVAHGRLMDARDLARAIAVEDPADPKVAHVRASAARIAKATDLASAGFELGRLGRACGSCHEATGADVVFVGVAPPARADSLAAQMHRHEWAAARLWEGLVGPDDASWQSGASTLATVRFDVARTVHERPNAEVFEQAERLRVRAFDALESHDRDRNASIYAEMMTACVGCHRIARPHAVARR